ncbi:hypothetical protein BDZ88DRAFT_424779 [Geranomyces variabilis]|nr:hypothetical protein BDZ88DRAFT_424779 [Geranomyces variabilis]KAJ3140726.1 hypothetical protein HDU90_008030 [Geranomyces variabilis]
MHIAKLSLAALLGASVVAAQLGPTYKCDPAVCKPPACRCASTAAPVANPPQFLMLTFDDSIQDSVWTQAQSLIANRKNPNGCPARATWYTQVFYSDPYLTQTWYAQGNEIADHTIDHITPTGTYQQVEGMRKWANELAGIPLGQIKGFRYPFLNYSAESIAMLTKMGFEYESSMSASGGDVVWPYTLDYGTVNDCLGINPLCGVNLNATGLWEVPMYGTTGPDGAQHLMDPYNDAGVTPEATTANYRTAFDAHYAGTHVPFGVYLHPQWLGKTAPNPTNPAVTADGTPKLNAVAAFLDYAMSRPNTWMITASQMVEYMKNPVPADQLTAQPYMSCTPNPPLPTNICNGVAGATAAGAAAPETCNLITGAFKTCYGCPVSAPTLQDPSPAKVNTARFPLPKTCDSLWWDPVTGKCTCTADGCKYTDTARAINMDPNSIKAVAAGNGTAAGANGTSSATPGGASAAPGGASTTAPAKAAASGIVAGLEPLYAAAAAVVVGIFA